MIVAASTLFIAILIINSLYEGAIAKPYDDELLGNMTDNITSFTVDHIPISSDSTHTIVLKNQTATFTTPCGAAPCYDISSYALGNVTVNVTGETGDATTYIIYMDYFDTKMAVGTGLSTAIAAFSYLWVALGFMGLGILVMGAVYVMKVIRQMRDD